MYPEFADFNDKFTCDEPFMDLFFNYVMQEDSSLHFNAEEYEISKDLIALRLKSYVARNLWDMNEFYQVYNASNEILNRAIGILNNKEYEKIELDH